jgi:hypothetical protein
MAFCSAGKREKFSKGFCVSKTRAETEGYEKSWFAQAVCKLCENLIPSRN